MAFIENQQPCFLNVSEIFQQENNITGTDNQYRGQTINVNL